jgi:capsid portal protein
MDTGVFARVGESLPAERRASEMLFLCNYHPATPYGLPRYIGLDVDIDSSREAQEDTYDFLRNNAIPKVLMFLLGGALTKSGNELLKDALSDVKARGKAKNRAVLVEADPVSTMEGPTAGGSSASRVGLEVVRLNDLQQGDAMFREFRKDHREDLRQAFRFGGIFLGRSDDANFATANVAMTLAEQQVFAPEREAFDAMMNRQILPALGIRYW